MTTSYLYYGTGQLAKSDQGGQLRKWFYNWLGQMTSQDLPESGITTFAYDAAGRLTTKTDARNIVTTHAYDDANRPTSKTYSDTTPSIAWTYDANGYTGLRTGMADQIGQTANAYDQNNRPTHEWRGIYNVTGTFLTSFAYNVKGDMTAMLYPSGRIVAFNYATGGGCCNSRLASVTDTTTTQTIINGLTYNAAGDTLTQTLGSGGGAVTQTMSYNSRLQLTHITANLSGAAVMNFTYDYGNSTTNTGRAQKRTDAIQPEHSARYVYDSIYRLSTVTADDTTVPWALGWTLDIWGNRLTQTPQGEANGKAGSQTLGYTNNRLTTYSYDAAGNQTSDGLHTYTYDAENKIKSMDGGTAAYGYDGSGNRMSKTVAGVTTYYFYGPGGLLTEFSTATGVTAAATTDRTTVHTSDRLGSISLSVSTAGLIVENNRTLPYGESWLTQTASTNDKKFTSYQRDGESALDYAMNRYYANTNGRFASVDSGRVFHWIPTSLNRYVYTGSDPINQTDPTGNEWYWPPWLCDEEGCFPQPAIPWFERSGCCGVESGWANEEEVKEREIDRRKLVSGVEQLLANKECRDFVVGVLQNAFLEVNNVDHVDSLGAFERDAYYRLTADAVVESLRNATFVDGGTALPTVEGGRSYQTIARAYHANNAVSFYNGFFAQGSTGQAQTALHEGMHLQWNLGDVNFAKAALVYRPGMGGSEASAAWSAALTLHCK